MIEISLGKMVLLALIALIVLGPEKLPGAARTAGALLRRVRSGWDNVRAEVERELEIEEIRRSAREAVAGAEAAQKQVRETLKQAHDPFSEAAAMVRLQPGSSSPTADPLLIDPIHAAGGSDSPPNQGATDVGTGPSAQALQPAPTLAKPPSVDPADDAAHGTGPLQHRGTHEVGSGQSAAAPAQAPSETDGQAAGSPQAELPLDTPQRVPVARKDGLHGNA